MTRTRQPLRSYFGILAIAAACGARSDSPAIGAAEAAPDRGSTSSAAPAPASAKPPPVAPKPAPGAPRAEPTPEARARDFIARQLAALPDDDDALASMFAPGAGIFLPNHSADLEDLHNGGGRGIAYLSPHGEMKSARLVHLVAGGDASVVWLAADLELEVVEHEPGEPAPVPDRAEIRVVELLDAAAGWRAVAASFTKIRPLRQLRSINAPIQAPTPPGPLVRLLAAPEALADALARKALEPVIVLGTDRPERAVGRDSAVALLKKWRNLRLEIEPQALAREVHTKAWAYAMAEVKLAKAGGPPFRMSAFLIALPAPRGGWSVVAASYGAR